MSELARRRFLAALAYSIVAGTGIGYYSTGAPQSGAAQAGAATPLASGRTQRQVLPPPPASARIPLPGDGVLSILPGSGDLLALTVDDGVNSDVVRLYTEFARDSGVRLTYFVNGVNASWTEHAALLRPLVDSGQIQLGNHTWSHPNLTTVPASKVVSEITRNDTFLQRTYGVDARPYLRPPYGSYNAAVAAAAAEVGYTIVTMWSGSLADSSPISEDYIVQMAQQYFTAQRIVIGHLNHLPVTHVYGRLLEIIQERALRPVTLNDVFRRPTQAV